MESYGEEHLRLFETIARIAAEAIGKSMEHNEVKAHALTDPMTGCQTRDVCKYSLKKRWDGPAVPAAAFNC
jgi:hypothetical protein